MTSRIEGVYQWVSPVCFAMGTAMVFVGLGSAEPMLQGWAGAIFWATVGALAATAIFSAVLGFLAAQQHLRLARGRVDRHRREVSGGNRPLRRGEFQT
jgi:hypothetical protein